jgi:hypothetical protein
MQRSMSALIAAAMLLASPMAFARGGGAHGSYSTGTHGSSTSTTHGSHSKAAPGAARDSHGKIARSQKAKDDFKKEHPCPSTGRSSGSCPGYVIDHVTPLKRGGADAPSNMQWQTIQEAKAKDKWE